jgi:hypothetical protein
MVANRDPGWKHATMPGMQDHELYRRILGIEAPWFVDSVDLKLEFGVPVVDRSISRQREECFSRSNGTGSG